MDEVIGGDSDDELSEGFEMGKGGYGSHLFRISKNNYF